jgi:hypothetical protein
MSQPSQWERAQMEMRQEREADIACLKFIRKGLVNYAEHKQTQYALDTVDDMIRAKEEALSAHVVAHPEKGEEAPRNHTHLCEFCMLSWDTPTPHDDPEADCTDAAHPAWWRGQEYGAHAMIRAVRDALDGRDDGSGTATEPWESLRRRLLALAAPPPQGPSEEER